MQGVGKDTAFAPIFEALGEHNVGTIKPEDLAGQFTPFLENQIVCVQEMSNFTKREAGDAANMGPPLTPVTGPDGNVVRGNILEGNRHKPDYRGVPSVAFTMPPIAPENLVYDGYPPEYCQRRPYRRGRIRALRAAPYLRRRRLRAS